jgi:hypothetical protein
MSGTRSMNREIRSARFLVGKPHENIQHLRHWRGLEDNIKVDLK